MFKYDLHVHSTYSDGKYSKEDLLELARLNQIEVIAFCDHNDCSNIDSKIIKKEYEKKYARKSDVLIIPAIEISAYSEEYRGIHMLGYGILNSNIIQKRINEINMINQEAVFKQIKLLKEEFEIPITKEMVLDNSKNKIITTKDLEELLIKMKIINSKKEMYQFTNINSKSHVDKVKIGDVEAIKLIHNAGGIAVLAHPIEIEKKCSREKIGISNEYEEYLKYLILNGLDGVETHTVKHTNDLQESYYKIAKKYNLLTTAGTDFHDEKRTPCFGVEYNPELFLKPLLSRLMIEKERKNER